MKGRFRRMLYDYLNQRIDMKGIKESWHYLALFTVSCYVFYNAEQTLS
jgi:hypothetical protein